MRRLMVLEAPLVRVRPAFAGRAILAEGLTRDCIGGFSGLDSPLQADRALTIRKLALLCLVRFEEPRFDPRPTISLLDHLARFSPDDGTRKECMEALAILGQRERLESLTFEPGSEGSRRHRDGLLSRLFPQRQP